MVLWSTYGSLLNCVICSDIEWSFKVVSATEYMLLENKLEVQGLKSTVFISMKLAMLMHVLSASPKCLVIVVASYNL